MSDQYSPHKRQLSGFAARPILSLVNEVRHKQRKAVTFISDGQGGLIETHTNMNILNSEEEKHARDRERLREDK